ncbi:MAG: hypothetical protein PVG11_07900 [Anaerolineae bacterium]|jgi:hypothetical protein
MKVRSVALLILCACLLIACDSGAGPGEVQATATVTVLEGPAALPTAVPPEPGRALEAGTWAISFRYDFPPDTFGEGLHRYAFLARCPPVSSEDITSPWHTFQVSDDVVRQTEPVYLRLHGLSTDAFNPTAMTNDTIHPERPIIAIIHFVGLPQSAAGLAANCEAIVLWDDVGRHALEPGEPFQP